MSRKIFRILTLNTADFCIPGTENLHLIFSYSVWVLRDFPEDGLKVSVVETRQIAFEILSAVYGIGRTQCKKPGINAKLN